MMRLYFVAAATVALSLARPGITHAEPAPLAPNSALDPATAKLVPTAAPAPLVVAAPPKEATASGPEITLAFGFRGVGFASAGFDPYGSKDFVGMLSIAGGPTFLRAGKVSLAALGEWNVGTAHASARGDETKLAVHRLAIALESRYQIASRLGLFIKVAPGAYHLRASIEDAGFNRSLVSRSWTYALDATGGAALMFAQAGEPEAPKARFWFTGELGYAFAGTTAMVFKPAEEDDDTRQYGSTKLPDFRPSGPIGRLAFAVSF